MFTNALVGKFFYFTPFYVPELNVGKIAAESCYQQNNNLGNIKNTVRVPANIYTGTNILKLEPGIYDYEDSNASEQDKLNMGFPKAFWHSRIIVRGYWANDEKTTGYIEIFVIDTVTEAKIYYRSFGWNEWGSWKCISMDEVNS